MLNNGWLSWFMMADAELWWLLRAVSYCQLLVWIITITKATVKTLNSSRPEFALFFSIRSSSALLKSGSWCDVCYAHMGLSMFIHKWCTSIYNLWFPIDHSFGVWAYHHGHGQPHPCFFFSVVVMRKIHRIRCCGSCFVIPIVADHQIYHPSFIMVIDWTWGLTSKIHRESTIQSSAS